jgi:hypothetical protein
MELVRRSFRASIEAGEIKRGPDDWKWDQRTRQYIKPNGKEVTPAEVNKTGQRVVDKSVREMEKLTKQFVDGKIPLPEWAAQMKESVKGTHSAMGQLAHGGKKMMGAKERGLLGADMRAQYEHLNRFVLQVESGKVKPGDGMIARAKMYGHSGWTTYSSAVGQREKYAGMREERSILESAARHCDDCTGEARKGWEAIGTLIPIGERQCLGMCKCELEYR